MYIVRHQLGVFITFSDISSLYNVHFNSHYIDFSHITLYIHSLFIFHTTNFVYRLLLLGGQFMDRGRSCMTISYTYIHPYLFYIILLHYLELVSISIISHYIVLSNIFNLNTNTMSCTT